MASRGSRKPGTHRMDGAIAALTPLGFSKRLICSTINELKKAYGDEDAAWYFVEENYYKLVIDNIMEKQDKDKEEQYVKNEEITLKAACYSFGLISYYHSNLRFYPIETEEKALVHTGTPETCKQALIKLEADDSNSRDILKIEGHSNSSCLLRRKPCYGWISDDED